MRYEETDGLHLNCHGATNTTIDYVATNTGWKPCGRFSSRSAATSATTSGNASLPADPVSHQQKPQPTYEKPATQLHQVQRTHHGSKNNPLPPEPVAYQ